MSDQRPIAAAPAEGEPPPTNPERPPLARYLAQIHTRFDVPASRRLSIASARRALKGLRRRFGRARVVFLCTHNARRSQLAQALASAAAQRSGNTDIEFASAGSRRGRVHPWVLKVLEDAGYAVRRGRGMDARHRLDAGLGGPEIVLYSKTVDALDIDEATLIVHTCLASEAHCPSIPALVASPQLLSYDDPGDVDGTGLEANRYALTRDFIARDVIALLDDELPAG